eukprot:scaffold1054_cov116-Isochrysis_galbana.AAC.18
MRACHPPSVPESLAAWHSARMSQQILFPDASRRTPASTGRARGRPAGTSRLTRDSNKCPCRAAA